MPVFLIRSHFSKSFMLHSPLTPAGQAYAEIQTDAIHDKRVENIKYVITTAIAVIALILAGISLAAQLGLIQLPQA